MYRSLTNGPAYARIFRRVGTNQSVYSPGDAALMQYRGDALFFPQGDTSGITCGLVSDPMLVSDFLRVPSFDFEHPLDNSFRTEKPFQIEWSRGLDWKYYGNPLGIGSLLANKPSSVFAHERAVSHPAYRGEVVDSEELPLYRYTTLNNHYHYDMYVDKFTSWPLPHAIGLIQATGLNSLGYFTWITSQLSSVPNIDGDFWHIFCQVADLLSGAGSLSYSPSYYWSYTWSDLVNTSFKVGNFHHLGLEYKFKRDFNFGQLFATFSVKVDVDLMIGPSHGSNSTFLENPISTDCFSYRNNNSYSFYSSGGWEYSPIPDMSMPAIQVEMLEPAGLFSPIVQRDDSVVSSRFFAFRRQASSDPDFLHNKLRFQTQNLLQELRPSAFFSASDALNKHLEVLKANHLENLTQLTGLLSILPNLPKLPRIVSKLTSGDPSAIIEAIDYVTDAIIKFRYAQSPTVGDAIELVTTNVLGELRSLLQSKTYILYGRFFWEFPEENNYMGDGRLTLVTRSKISITVDLSTLLANYLTLNSMGVLPSLANVWATLPFSFVVDWFTNMDDRLKAVDNQLLWLCLRTNWSVHSYKVSYYPSAEHLELYQLESPTVDDPFHATAYFREPSLIMPLLRESKFDFLAPNHGPDPLIVGALTWQKLRS